MSGIRQCETTDEAANGRGIQRGVEITVILISAIQEKFEEARSAHGGPLIINQRPERRLTRGNVTAGLTQR